MKNSQPIHTTLWTSIVLLMSLPGFAAQEETPNVISDTTMIIKTESDTMHTKLDTIKGAPGKEHYAATQSSGNSMRIQTALVADKPQKKCSNIHVDSVGVSTVNLSWQTGDGEGRAIFISSDTLGHFPQIVDKTDYIANSFFGKGDSVGMWRCVYNGNGASVSIDGLIPATQYRAIAFEKNGHDQYAVWLNDTTTNTTFITSTPPIIVSTAVPASIVAPPVAPAAIIAPPPHNNQLFFYGAGAIGAIGIGIITMLIVTNGHHGSDAPAAGGHDLGTPPINPSAIVH